MCQALDAVRYICNTVTFRMRNFLLTEKAVYFRNSSRSASGSQHFLTAILCAFFHSRECGETRPRKLTPNARASCSSKRAARKNEVTAIPGATGAYKGTRAIERPLSSRSFAHVRRTEATERTRIDECLRVFSIVHPLDSARWRQNDGAAWRKTREERLVSRDRSSLSMPRTTTYIPRPLVSADGFVHGILWVRIEAEADAGRLAQQERKRKVNCRIRSFSSLSRSFHQAEPGLGLIQLTRSFIDPRKLYSARRARKPDAVTCAVTIPYSSEGAHDEDALVRQNTCIYRA